MTRRKLTVFGCVVASALCLVGIAAYRVLGPWYDGRPLDYWLAQLKPAVWKPTPGTEFHGPLSDAIAWQAERDKMHERACAVLKRAGPECLPVLLKRLACRDQLGNGKSLRTLGFTMQRWAYRRGLVSHAQWEESDYSYLSRGQAVAAIIALGDRAAPLVPQLSELATRRDSDDVTVAATIALVRIAPAEYQRIGAPQFHRQELLGAKADRKD